MLAKVSNNRVMPYGWATHLSVALGGTQAPLCGRVRVVFRDPRLALLGPQVAFLQALTYSGWARVISWRLKCHFFF